MSSIHPRPATLAAIGLSLALVLTGCSSPGASTVSIAPDATSSVAPAVTPSAVASAAPSVAPSASAAAVVYPLTLTDDEGTAVVIPAAPKKVVSLTPANTEILYAIGAGDRVVATDSGSDYPAEAEPLPDVATYDATDVEKIVGLDADLVVAGGLGFTNAAAIAQLRDLGVPVLVLYAPSIDGAYHDIDLIGQATGDVAAATDLTAGMRSEISAIGEATKAAPARRVFYDVGYDDGTGQIFAPAKDSFLADMVTLAGGDAITTADASSYEIPLEDLIKADPETIVLGINAFYMPTPAEVKARTGWDVLTAVKDDDIRPVEDTEITRPGPRLPSGLRKLAAVIQPDVVLPSASPGG